MSDSEADKARKATARLAVIMGAFGTVVAILHITLVGSFFILEYAGVAVGLFALVGGLIMMLTQKPNA
jgi:hypothetical protein